jgi:hypothetical protein
MTESIRFLVTLVSSFLLTLSMPYEAQWPSFQKWSAVLRFEISSIFGVTFVIVYPVYAFLHSEEMLYMQFFDS